MAECIVKTLRKNAREEIRVGFDEYHGFQIARAFSMISGSRRMLYLFVVPHFPDASRRPPRWKML